MFNPFKTSKRAPAPAGKTVKLACASAAEASERKAETPAADTKHRRFIGIIIAPHQTEKAGREGGRGWYTFAVDRRAQKAQVWRAVEERYGVRVQAVHVLAARSRAVRLGRIRGRSAGFKKAMVRVKEGQSIEFT